LGARIVELISQSYLPWQGRYPRVSAQAKALQRAGHEVTVLACDREARHPLQDVVEGVPVERLPIRAAEMGGPVRHLRPLLQFYRRAREWADGRAIDVLVCHNLDAMPLGLRLRKRTGCKLLFDSHEPHYYAMWGGALRMLLPVVERLDLAMARRADGVTVTNTYQENKYRRAGVRAVSIVGNFTPPACRIARIDPARFQDAVTRFGRFGTFFHGVGLEPAAEAFRQLRAGRGDVELLLGGRVLESYQPVFDDYVGKLRPGVTVLGRYESAMTPELYARIHVSVLTYPLSRFYRHITPLKFYDSLSNGVPVIMSDIGGLGDVIRRHGCGIVVDPTDVNGIRVAMDRLASDRELLRTMSENALAAAEREFSWEHLERACCDAVAELLQVQASR
jgi:glycosyltransferase involved in cell wall biosynthesis